MTPQTIASPLCSFGYLKPCSRQGRAVLGPEERRGDSLNRTVVCTKCGATGDQSRPLGERPA